MSKPELTKTTVISTRDQQVRAREEENAGTCGNSGALVLRWQTHYRRPDRTPSSCAKKFDRKPAKRAFIDEL
jgi:hypothetical protein